MDKLYVLLGKLLNLSDAVNSGLDDYGKNDSLDQGARDMWVDMLKKLAVLIDQFLPVAMIVLGLVAVVYVIILGSKYAHSETNDEKNEVKKKLINGIIGFAIGLFVMALMFVFLNNVPAVAKWINGKTESGGTWY